MRLNVKFTTVQPLCQIHDSQPADARNPSRILLKRQKVMGVTKLGAKLAFNSPYYTGNGFRGMLRREMLNIMLNNFIKNDGDTSKISAVSFHLMNAGGGNNFQSQAFKIEDKVRELNPLISLFGTSLAIEGKLNISNLVPYDIDENGEKYHPYIELENDKGNPFLLSSIVGVSKAIKQDGIIDRDKNSSFLTKETIIQWIEDNLENIKKRNANRENKNSDTKVKKTGIKGVFEREYVAIGVDFYGSITNRNKFSLTDIEKGLLIKSLEQAVLNNLGSTEANDFGKVEYSITIDEDSKLETSVNEYNECIISKRAYSKKTQSYIEQADEFLKNISIENLLIENVLEN